MWLTEILLFSACIIAVMYVIPWLVFALASLLEGFPRLRLRQVLGIIAVTAWIFGFFATNGSRGGVEIMVLGTVTSCLIAFAGMWKHEFRLLMLRRSDEFPDRSDKLAWTFTLVVLAPAGVWLFRSYRRARWAEPSMIAPGLHPLDDPSGDGAVPEMSRIGA